MNRARRDPFPKGMRWVFVLALVAVAFADLARDTAIDGGGGWLASQQDLAGSGAWLATPGGEPHIGATSMSLLAYLGAGYTDRGTVKTNRYGANVRHGLRFLRNLQERSGRFPGADARQQAWGALALSEAWWMTGNPRYKLPARRAVAYLAKIDAGQDPVARALRVAAACKLIRMLPSGSR